MDKQKNKKHQFMKSIRYRILLRIQLKISSETFAYLHPYDG